MINGLLGSPKVDSEKYLLLVTAYTAINVEAQSLCLAADVLNEVISYDDFLRLTGEQQSFCSLWSNLYTIRSQNMGSFAQSEYRIEDLKTTKDGYSFDLYTTVHFTSNAPDQLMPTPPINSENTICTRVSTNQGIDSLDYFKAQQEIENARAQAYFTVMDSLLAAASSTNPATAIAYAAIKSAMGIANGNYADAFKNGSEGLITLWSEMPGTEGTAALSGIANSIAAIWAFGLSIQSLGSAEQENINKVWADYFGWGTNHRIEGGNLVSSLNYAISPKTFFSLMILQQGGMRALCDFRFGEQLGAKNYQLITDTIEKIEFSWRENGAPTTVDHAVEDFLLRGVMPDYGEYTQKEFTDSLMEYLADYDSLRKDVDAPHIVTDVMNTFGGGN